jgi:hypothetical protein
MCLALQQCVNCSVTIERLPLGIGESENCFAREIAQIHMHTHEAKVTVHGQPPGERVFVVRCPDTQSPMGWRTAASRQVVYS